jgi:integrase/recombinase XerD
LAANLPYFNPHSFRKTLALLGERTCRTPEEFKAWSQNLGPEQVLTTFTSYGEVSMSRQAEIMNVLAKPSATKSELTDLTQQLIQAIQRSEIA